MDWLSNTEVWHWWKLLHSPQFYQADILCARVILSCSFRHTERAEKGTKEPKQNTEYGFWYSQWKNFERQNLIKKCRKGMIQMFSQAILPHIKGSLVFWGWLVKRNLKMAFLITYQRFVMTALREMLLIQPVMISPNVSYFETSTAFSSHFVHTYIQKCLGISLHLNTKK